MLEVRHAVRLLENARAADADANGAPRRVLFPSRKDLIDPELRGRGSRRRYGLPARDRFSIGASRDRDRNDAKEK
jgi:hypothetical protein